MSYLKKYKNYAIMFNNIVKLYDIYVLQKLYVYVYVYKAEISGSKWK